MITDHPPVLPVCAVMLCVPFPLLFFFSFFGAVLFVVLSFADQMYTAMSGFCTSSHFTLDLPCLPFSILANIVFLLIFFFSASL